MKKKKWLGRQPDTRSFREKLSMTVAYLLSESLAGVFLAASLSTLLYQGYHWLMQGYWLKLPLLRFLYKIPGFSSWEWLHHPDKWLVLHSIVSFILNFGLAAFFALLAAVSVWIGTVIRED